MEEIIDLEEGSRCVIPARLDCLVVGQPFDRLRAGSFQAVVLTGWKAGPTGGIPDSVARTSYTDRDSSRGSQSGTGFQPVGLIGWKPVPLKNDSSKRWSGADAVVSHKLIYGTLC